MGGRGFVAECGAGAEELAKVRQRLKDEEGSPRGELAPAGRLRGECCLYAFLANPSPSSLRDATSPQGEAFTTSCTIQSLQSNALCGILDILIKKF